MQSVDGGEEFEFGAEEKRGEKICKNIRNFGFPTVVDFFLFLMLAKMLCNLWVLVIIIISFRSRNMKSPELHHCTHTMGTKTTFLLDVFHRLP